MNALINACNFFVAVPLKDFPEYVQKMQGKDGGKKSMLANEYEVSKNISFQNDDLIPFHAEL